MKLTKFSLPAALALLVVTALTALSQNAPDSKTSSDSGNKGQQRDLSAQEKNQQSTFRPPRVSDSELKKSVKEVNKASSFIGMSVQNLQNEKLGTVKDLVFDPSTGKISYAVLSVGGFLRVGDKLIAVPLTSIRPQPGQKYLVLNMSKDELTAAPGLAKDNWPNLDAASVGAPAASQEQSATSSAATANTADSAVSSDKNSDTKASSEKSNGPKDSSPENQQPDRSSKGKDSQNP
jgi:sporulation protein YlmC with PRC-barrel domain